MDFLMDTPYTNIYVGGTSDIKMEYIHNIWFESILSLDVRSK